MSTRTNSQVEKINFQEQQYLNQRESKRQKTLKRNQKIRKEAIKKGDQPWCNISPNNVVVLK